jgi:CRP/FNR family transcriptional regulator
MLDQEQYRRTVRSLPFLQEADAELVRAFRRSAFLAHIPTGRDVFLQGDPVDNIALLISGIVRVYKIGESGREITLYRFGLGESCILTANAILSRQSFPAIATVERDAEAIMIPADTFRRWIGRYELWRSFVFDLLSQRLTSVLEIVDQVTFRRMDARVASLLLNRSRRRRPIQITHQEIADELGSSREVISRILKSLADEGLVNTSRGQIELLDTHSLESRSFM